jgi:hypothetical protein
VEEARPGERHEADKWAAIRKHAQTGDPTMTPDTQGHLLFGATVDAVTATTALSAPSSWCTAMPSASSTPPARPRRNFTMAHLGKAWVLTVANDAGPDGDAWSPDADANAGSGQSCKRGPPKEA